MKRAFLMLIGSAVFAQGAFAQSQSLFTTSDDFTLWQSANSFTVLPVISQDSDGSTVNGLGNTNAFGATGTGGAVAIQFPQGGTPYNYAAGTPGEQGLTNGFIAALLQPGKVLTFDYITPPTNAGTYFNLGVVVNCEGRFDQLFPTSTTSLGGGWTRATIDWTSEAAALVTQQVSNGGTFTYFQMLVIYNSDFSPTKPFYIDNYTLRNTPPPPVNLYTTTNDFTGWTTEVGFSNVGPTNFDLDGGLTNGIGNTVAPGAAGTPGSLQIQHVTGSFGVASYGPFEQTNTAFLTALEQASVLNFDYITPAVGTGTFFEVGIVVNCQGRFDQLFPTATVALSNGISRASIDWSTEAQALVTQQAANGGSFSNFQIGIIWNSDYNPGATPFQVDNITVTTNAPAPYLVPAGGIVASESCTPTNGAIDPGENVTVSLVLQNTGNNSLSNVVGALLATGGVNSPSSPQLYGTLLAGGGSATNSYTFTAGGTCGNTLTATLLIQTNSVTYRTIPFSFTLGALGGVVTNTYSSGGIATAIPDNNSTGIVSSIFVGDANTILHVSVRVRINHTYDGDLSIDLLPPTGPAINLQASNEAIGGANYGSGSTDCNGTFTVFDDSAATPIGGASPPYAGTFRPVQMLSALNGGNSQGSWGLRVIDHAAGDVGTLYCWQLVISGQSFVCCTGAPPTDAFTIWENHYFTVGELGSPSFSGANADPFGKGMKNTNQFLAGFNPTNAAAYVHITNITKTNTGADIRVDYLGASGDSTYSGGPGSRTNVLEFTTGAAGNYNSNNFVSTGVSNILSGGTGLGTVTNMVDIGGATNKPSRYYRVRVLVP